MINGIQKHVFFILMLCIVSFANSKTVQLRIDEMVKNQKLSAHQGLYLKALALYEPEMLPEQLAAYKPEIVKSGFSIIGAVRLNWSRFSEEQQRILKPHAYRPAADTSVVSASGRFRIHYDVSGFNTVDPADTDLNGIPDYIDVVARVADSVYVIEVEELGLKAPLDDNNTDGPEWDIYIRNLPNVYGQTTPEKQVASNPDQYYGYIELDNNYQHTYTKGLHGMRVTLAHEFFHLIHMAYNLRTSNFYTFDDLFLMEASSTWMEDYVYDHINDYYAYITSFFRTNNVPFDYVGNNHEYGLALWWHYIETVFQTPDLIRETWEAIAEWPALEALDKVLHSRGYTFNDAMTEFYSWNIMTADRSDPSRFYEEGAFYPQIVFDEADTIQTSRMIETAIKPLAVRYFSYQDSEETQIILAPVNVSRQDQASQNLCQLYLHKGIGKPGYTALGRNFFGALVSDDDWPWQFAAAIKMQEIPWMLNTYTESKEGFGASLSGLVFHDANADGQYDAGEPGLNGLLIQLYETGPDSLYLTEDDIVFPVQQSQSDGHFEFNALAAGNYYLSFDPASVPSGMLFTTRNTPFYVALEQDEVFEEVTLGFRSFDEISLPAAIPQPYILNRTPHLKIPFSCDEAGNYALAIYSGAGYCLYSEELYFDAAEVQFFEWPGIDHYEKAVPAGIYIYLISYNGQCIRKDKIAVIK